MQNKLKPNWEYYFDNDTQIYYTENRCGNKALKYLQLHFCADSLILFEIVDDLFTKLEEVYDNSHCKDYVIEKFKELKIGSGSFNNFYSKFIKLRAKLKFIKEILLQKFMHKLSLHIQNLIKFEL